MKLLQRAVAACATMFSILVLVPPAIASASTLVITTKSLPNTNVGSVYSKQITAKGGTAPRTFSVTDGSLPSGLTLSSSGLLSGTPSAPGIFTFTVGVADSGTPQQTDSHTYTIKVRIFGPWTLCTYSSGSGGNNIDGVTLFSNGTMTDVDGATGSWTLNSSNKLTMNFNFRNFVGSWDPSRNQFDGTYTGPDSGTFAMVSGQNAGANCIQP